jgi:hypothetical protein
MLSLPLFRGFGLMFVVAPCYRQPKKRKLQQAPRWRPKLTCPPIEGDLLKDAHALFDSGNLIAAAMTARVELERQLTTLALMNPSFGEDWRGIFTTAAWLHKRLVIRQNAFNLVTEAGEIGNRAAHGGSVTKIEVARMFNAVDSLRHTVRRKGGVA